MPGIVGIITKQPREKSTQDLGRMVKAQCHEPSYQTGTHVEESLGVWVGWVARKDSFADGMPLCNERGDIVLIFSGEEYPSGDVRQRLKEHGHDVSPTGPSYLVHLSEEEPAFPATLNGRFHGILIDKSRETLTLFNDRYGMHRIYYHEAKEAFYFAAEAKAILAVCPELREIDLRSMGEYVSCGCVLENKSLFKGIHVLPPASAWTIRAGVITRKNYFQPAEWENQEILEPEKYYQELRGVFEGNLPRYFAGKEKICMSLTGGLDTRMIMAWQQFPPGGLPCYSFGGIYRDCQDVQVGRQVAQVCGQSHQVIPVEKDFLSRFPNYVERSIYYTDGCVEPSRSPDLYVNEIARGISPVRMTGNYGGEVLRRVRAFKPVEPSPGLFAAEVISNVKAAKETYAGLIKCHPLSFSVFRQAPWHHYGLQALEQTQISVRSPFLDNDFVKMVFRAPQSTLANNDICIRLISDGNKALTNLRTDRGLMGNGVAPLAAITRGLLEFTFKAEYAYDYGMPHWVAQIDRLFQPLHLERLFLGRHKFYHFRIWYRDALSAYIRETLLSDRALSRPYIDGKRMKELILRHLSGTGNYTTEIHKTLTLELVHRLLLESR